MEQENLLAMNLRFFRNQMGISQKTAADLLNINRSSYSYYEVGKLTPDPKTLYRISKIYGVPLESFFEKITA